MFPESDKEFKHIDDTMYGIADYVIAHNSRMKDYLIDKGVSPDKIYELGIFDYLTDCETESKTIKYAKTLNIAGNLDTGKCKYIKELNNLKKIYRLICMVLIMMKMCLIQSQYIIRESFHQMKYHIC